MFVFFDLQIKTRSCQEENDEAGWHGNIYDRNTFFSPCLKYLQSVNSFT